MLEIIKSSGYAEYMKGGISLLVSDVNLYSGCLKLFWSYLLSTSSGSLQGRMPKQRGKKEARQFVSLIN